MRGCSWFAKVTKKTVMAIVTLLNLHPLLRTFFQLPALPLRYQASQRRFGVMLEVNALHFFVYQAFDAVLHRALSPIYYSLCNIAPLFPKGSIGLEEFEVFSKCPVAMFYGRI
eukprot:CAMPEP_0204919980 /NCGR_PEP_ID=MMETSP1397-20131031/17118_1 /ASSEMBLY_ACC=CAM_ASM_000891 /TAXON_ID=49980 /ORGANISM="Climacostomum Climacostomum virens, Strain Stock W-24" /LENGTH=112 /DNA_ID=CAMNT_0052093627 /DNA_START=60 /DNA_END=398 /DNA_ORIENTATION=-